MKHKKKMTDGTIMIPGEDGFFGIGVTAAGHFVLWFGPFDVHLLLNRYLYGFAFCVNSHDGSAKPNPLIEVLFDTT